MSHEIWNGFMGALPYGMGFLILFFLCLALRGHTWKVRPAFRYILRPTVYVCQLNGIYGVVRAKDYNRAARQHWWRNEKWGLQRYDGWEMGACFVVEPKFLFGNVKTLHSILTGDLSDMSHLLEGCRVEARHFELPSTWSHYPGDTNVRFLMNGGSGQRNVYTMDEAQNLIYGSQRRRDFFARLGSPFSYQTARG